MTRHHYTSEEIARKGKDLYRQKIQPILDSHAKGKYVVIDIETGNYEIDDDHLTASDRAAAKRPGAVCFAIRVGSPTLGRLGAMCRKV